MTSAYVGVLTSVGKSIGIPTIGNSVEFLQASVNAPIGIKQIVENFRQLQDSVQEVSNSVTNLVTRQGPVDNYVLLNEMTKFLGLWSKQVQEVSEQVTRAFGGLEAESGTTVRTIPPALTDLWQNMVKVFDDTVNSMVEQVNRLIAGDQKSKNGPLPSNSVINREDQKPSNVDLLKEFKNLLEVIQKRMKNLTQQLDNLIGSTGSSKKNNTVTNHNLIAEHKEGRI